MQLTSVTTFLAVALTGTVSGLSLDGNSLAVKYAPPILALAAPVFAIPTYPDFYLEARRKKHHHGGNGGNTTTTTGNGTTTGGNGKKNKNKNNNRGVPVNISDLIARANCEDA